jgi:hypothetical protein
LTVELSRATTLINRYVVQKLISQWRAANVPVVIVDAGVKDGCAVIRVEVERVKGKIVRDLPCNTRGFLLWWKTAQKGITLIQL